MISANIFTITTLLNLFTSIVVASDAVVQPPTAPLDKNPCFSNKLKLPSRGTYYMTQAYLNIDELKLRNDMETERYILEIPVNIIFGFSIGGNHSTETQTITNLEWNRSCLDREGNLSFIATKTIESEIIKRNIQGFEYDGHSKSKFTFLLDLEESFLNAKNLSADRIKKILKEGEKIYLKIFVRETGYPDKFVDDHEVGKIGNRLTSEIYTDGKIPEFLEFIGKFREWPNSILKMVESTIELTEYNKWNILNDDLEKWITDNINIRGVFELKKWWDANKSTVLWNLINGDIETNTSREVNIVSKLNIEEAKLKELLKNIYFYPGHMGDDVDEWLWNSSAFHSWVEHK